MKRLVVALLCASASLTAGQFELPLAQDRPSELFGAHPVVAGEVLVAFRQKPDLARLRADLDTDGDAIAGDGRIWRARSRRRGVHAMLAQLAARRDVLYAEPNYILYSTREPDDPRFPELWGLRNLGQTIAGVAGTPGADISATPAWDVAIGSRNAVVGVVDTGIDYSHPDLAGNVWSAPASFTVTVGGQAITCAAGTHGFNAINRTCDPMDDHFHGSHVSGTIGATANNGIGVAGVNWLANMMGLKFLASNGSGSVGDAINAIEFAIQAKTVLGPAAHVRVLSNSWAGGGFSQALFDAISRANQNDMLFVAAAGNNSSDNDVTPTYPAGYVLPNVIAVAATDNQDALATFSNFGATTVHLGAPGVKVLSTTPRGGYEMFSGTSMAAPHVSGAAALLLSRCTLTTAALKNAIISHVDPTAALAGKTITGGRLNVFGALSACTPEGNRAPDVFLTDPPGDIVVSAPDPIHLSAIAADDDGSIAAVAFYAGTAFLGSVTSAPYERILNNPLVGDYAITAVATDDNGATRTTNAATIHVLPGPASKPFQGVEASIPGVIEAENFNDGGEGQGYHDLTPGNSGTLYRQTDVDIVATTDGGDGFAVTSTGAGEWLAYRIAVGESAVYTVQARVASAGAGGILHAEVDGVDVTGPLTVPDTGGVQSWQTIGVQGVPLLAGSHVLRVVFDAKGTSGSAGNLNYVRVSLGGANTPPSVTLTSPAGGTSYTWPTNVTIRATAGDADGTVAQVSFYAGSTLITSDATTPYTATLTNPLPGAYALTAVATDNNGASTVSGAIAIQVAAPPPSTPFGGSPTQIPGVLEIENFDQGGEGVAYHDLSAGNTGGQYRTTDVDIERSSDTGGGYSIGWVSAGEWLMFTVSVAAPAAYTLEARVASPGTGGAFHLEVDRVAATGAIAVPATGGWQTWGTVIVPNIALTAGTHLVRVVFDTNGSAGFVGNMNYLKLTVPGSEPPPPPPSTSTPFGGTPVTIPGIVQIENFDEGGEGVAYHDTSGGNTGGQYRSTGVDIESTWDTGGGYNIGWVAAGEWLRYSIVAASTDVYALELRVANPGTGGALHVEVDGAAVGGTIAVPNTGGWQAWSSVTVPGLALSAGPHALRVVFDTNSTAGFVGNVNYLRWTIPGNAPPPLPPPASTPFQGVAAAIPGVIQIENFDEGGEGVAYHDTTAGNTGGAYRSTGVDIEGSWDTGGGYNIGWVVAGEWLQYTVAVQTTASYTLETRVASPKPGGSFHVEVDGVNATGALSIPSTNGWQTWATVTTPGIALTAGSHVVRIVFDANGQTGLVGNVNFLRWTTP